MEHEVLCASKHGIRAVHAVALSIRTAVDHCEMCDLRRSWTRAI